MRPDRGPADAYALLALQPGATRADIRRAYRRRALEVHPDIAGRDTTAEMAALNDARDLLLARLPGRRSRSVDDAAPGSPRSERRGPEPSYSHTPTWDDYWAAWNDPPRHRGP